MALSFFSRLQKALLLFSASLIMSCSSAQQSAPKAPPPLSLPAPARRAEFDVVAVFLPPDAWVESTWTTLRDELSPEFDVVPIPISKDSTPQDFARAFAEYSPKCVILFDNKTTHLYAQYQATLPQQEFPPAVILLSSYANLYTNVRNSTGIAYEVSLLLSATRLRSFVSVPVERVGVVYRRKFESYVRTQAELAKSEEVEVVPVEVSNGASPAELEVALSKLVRDEDVDALWVLNDNGLLTPEHISKGWLPTLDSQHVLTIVGIPTLVTKGAHFGTFAVLPDLSALGVQSATLVYDLADNDWKLPAGAAIEEPLSVRTVLDVDTAQRHFGLKEHALGELSEVAK